MTEAEYQAMLADREAGTPGPWQTDTGGEVHRYGTTIYAWPKWADGSGGGRGLERVDADMRRGARVPDLEAEVIRLRHLLTLSRDSMWDE